MTVESSALTADSRLARASAQGLDPVPHGHAGTSEGLKVHAALDQHSYPEGIKVSKAQADLIRLTPDEFHGEWNYTPPGPV